MDNLLEIVLIGLEFPIFLGAILWFVRLQSDASRRERVPLKFRNLSPRRKSLGILVIACFVFALYLVVAGLLSLTGMVTLPLAGVDSSVTLLMLGVGLVGLAYFMSITSTSVSNVRQVDGKP